MLGIRLIVMKKLGLGERRKIERARLHETLYVDFGPSSGAVTKGEGLDLSSTGIRFASPEKLEIHSLIDLKLRFCYEFTEMRVADVKARVIRCERNAKQRRYRVACAFVHPIPSETLHEIRNLIVWLRKIKKKYVVFRTSAA